jgi:hypothetical protein
LEDVDFGSTLLPNSVSRELHILLGKVGLRTVRFTESESGTERQFQLASMRQGKSLDLSDTIISPMLLCGLVKECKSLRSLNLCGKDLEGHTEKLLKVLDGIINSEEGSDLQQYNTFR